MNRRKTTQVVLGISIIAAVVNGLLAVGNVDRAVVARSAWSRIGLASWAAYTRQADLGNGQVFIRLCHWRNPALRRGGSSLSESGRMPRQAAWPVLLAATLMVIWLPISFEAAPFILSLRHINDQDAPGLARAFDGSYFWGRGQMVLHVAAFFANLWGIAALGRPDHPRRSGAD